MTSSYKITVRGPVPPDLARRIAEAHAQALKGRPMPQSDGQKTAP